MRRSATFDSTYTKQPGWFVGHRSHVSDALTTELSTILERPHLHKMVLLAASVVVGVTLAAFMLSPHLVQGARSIGSKDSSSQSTASQTSTDVTINGESVPVPTDGTIHKTYRTGNSQSTVDITVRNSSSSD